ncbi:MAG: methyltransferase domain-containing protein [Pseudorhodoplanes sp.]|nr:methyltransferase domain-containing protein [Pseudorhodoplanes sp.]
MLPAALQPLRSYLGTVKYGVRMAGALFGKFPRDCTVCGHHGRFLAFDNPLHLGLNIDSRCPRCRSLERHRLVALCDREKNLFEGREVLHFAPEPGMRDYILARKPRRYVTCDYAPDIADLRINIEQIDLPDNSFDVVYCLHVLEHVEDSRAIPELYRIVRPGGLLIAMVPLIEGWDTSYIDATKTGNDRDRTLHFNQEDHVRMFGRDFRERLKAPGFVVEEFTAVEPYVSRHGLIRGEKVFLCRKPA